ncbi:MAG TPA: hypothetical protein VF707_01310 [Ardenticatenaceae bacterium]|jgi:hypothetical protein
MRRLHLLLLPSLAFLVLVMAAVTRFDGRATAAQAGTTVSLEVPQGVTLPQHSLDTVLEVVND